MLLLVWNSEGDMNVHEACIYGGMVACFDEMPGENEFCHRALELSLPS